jgi:hypothetical protein
MRGVDQSMKKKKKRKELQAEGDRQSHSPWIENAPIFFAHLCTDSTPRDCELIETEDSTGLCCADT